MGRNDSKNKASFAKQKSGNRAIFFEQSKIASEISSYSFENILMIFLKSPEERLTQEMFLADLVNGYKNMMAELNSL